MTSQTILIIRHAEKPEGSATVGVSHDGSHDPRSLTPRGWQRAGAWAEVFSPSLVPHGALERPDRIFASAHGDTEGPIGSKSRRPSETVTPLARKLGLQVERTFTKGQEKELIAAIHTLPGAVLVCWQHERIPDMIGFIPTGDDAALPRTWPEDRYNVVLRFTRHAPDAVWQFDQVAPRMLADDPTHGI